MELESYAPLAVEDARQWLGIRQDDRQEDESLALLIDAVAESVEAYLPYPVRDREMHSVRPYAEDVPTSWPVAEVRRAVAYRGGVAEVVSAWPVPGGIKVEPVEGAEAVEVWWRAEGRCPAVVRQAMLVALKTAYENRTGPVVTDDVLAILRPEMRVNVRCCRDRGRQGAGRLPRAAVQ